MLTRSRKPATFWWSVAVLSMSLTAAEGMNLFTDHLEVAARESFGDSPVFALIRALHDRSSTAAVRAIDDGADVNAIGRDGSTPLLWVLDHETSRRSMEFAIRFLVERGANPNFIRQADSMSPMYFAVLQDSTDMLALFLEHGGDPNLLCAGGPALVLSVRARQIAMLEMLVQHGADVNLAGRPGASTAAEHAAALGFFEGTAWLLEHGYTNDLDRLGRYVDNSHVQPGTESDRWKLRVCALLRDRGVHCSEGRYDEVH
jgi:uncharacterized protein